tara:strand:- start:97 stop:351 length:255 start_codon:yes stop_codon:yes gene_type:complete
MPQKLVRTDSTILNSSERGFGLSPLGAERLLERLIVTLTKIKYVHDLQNNFNLIQKRVAICITFHNTPLNMDNIKDIVDKIPLQ